MKSFNNVTDNKKTFKRSLKIMGLAPLLALMLPAQALAQSCPADIAVGFEGGQSGPFELGELIPIEVTFSMGFAPLSETVEIQHFQYLLDCEGAASFDDCKTQGGIDGNEVTFIEDSVETTCTIDGVDPKVVVGTTDGVITVDFVPKEGNPAENSVILLDSTNVENTFNTCTVTFDVRVDALSDILVTKEVIEWAGMAGTDAQCRADEEFPITKEADDSLSFFIDNPNSIFWVTKDFTDDNPQGVDVHFRCDTGIILNPDFTGLTDPATDGTFDTVGFIVYGIPSIGANCTIYEEPIPAGYQQSYEAGTLNDGDYDELGELDDNEGCYYLGVDNGTYTCEITNTPKPAMFITNKEWVITGMGGEEVVEEAKVTIFCDSEIFESVPPDEEDDDYDSDEVFGKVFPPYKEGGEWRMKGVLGDEQYMTAKVDTTEGPAVCYATEKVKESAVESVDDCLKPRELKAGKLAQCTFVNTVFFEGIPTLNQYGMALMALLMLGLGSFAFRRYG